MNTKALEPEWLRTMTMTMTNAMTKLTIRLLLRPTMVLIKVMLGMTFIFRGVIALRFGDLDGTL